MSELRPYLPSNGRNGVWMPFWTYIADCLITQGQFAWPLLRHLKQLPKGRQSSLHSRQPVFWRIICSRSLLRQAQPRGFLASSLSWARQKRFDWRWKLWSTRHGMMTSRLLSRPSYVQSDSISCGNFPRTGWVEQSGISCGGPSAEAVFDVGRSAGSRAPGPMVRANRSRGALHWYLSRLAAEP